MHAKPLVSVIAITVQVLHPVSFECVGMSCTTRFSAALLISNGRAVGKVHGEISEISEISAATITCS
jgi:hypothetical protein